MVRVLLPEERLRHLRSLRAEIDREIDRLEQGLASGEVCRPYKHRLHPVDQRPKSVEVKRWAVEQGLLPHVKRGRVSSELLELYRQAHGENYGGGEQLPPGRTA